MGYDGAQQQSMPQSMVYSMHTLSKVLHCMGIETMVYDH